MKLLEDWAKKNTKPNVRAFSQLSAPWSSAFHAALPQLLSFAWINGNESDTYAGHAKLEAAL